MLADVTTLTQINPDYVVMTEIQKGTDDRYALWVYFDQRARPGDLSIAFPTLEAAQEARDFLKPSV